MKMTGVDPYGGHQLTIESDGVLVRLEAGYGTETGTVYLTPHQARFAAAALSAKAEIAERESGVTE